MKLLIALPAFNEEERLPAVLTSLPSVLDGVRSITVLVVDDGSTDRTAEVAEQAGARVIRHGVNRGVGTAFHSAVDEALRLGVDLMVSIDADGQFDPAEIPSLIEPIVNDRADFVTGNRFAAGRRPDRMPLIKYRGNRWLARIIRFFTHCDLGDVSCGYRAYSREALLHLNLFGRFTYTQETILDMAFKELRLTEAPISVRYFDNRRSRVAGSVFRYGVNASKIIMRTARDFKPMRFFGVAGLVLFVIGLVADAWLVGHWLRTGSFSPYKIVGFVGASLNGAGLLVGGLGVLADMLDRMRINQERLLYHHKKSAYRDVERDHARTRPEDS